MESSKLFLLLIGICCLALVRQAHAECCTSNEHLTFRMKTGTCSMVGATGSTTCEMVICADGKAIRGTYCGKNACDPTGCNCDGGCLTGQWSRSFVGMNKQYGIDIISARFSPTL